jgi:hypothetical protein
VTLAFTPPATERRVTHREAVVIRLRGHAKIAGEEVIVAHSLHHTEWQNPLNAIFLDSRWRCDCPVQPAAWGWEDMGLDLAGA